MIRRILAWCLLIALFLPAAIGIAALLGVVAASEVINEPKR